MTASPIPVTMQMSHAGKKEPRMLKDGARAQPARALRLPNATTAVVILCKSCTSLWSFRLSESALRSHLRRLHLDQIACLESEIDRLQQQLSARENVFRSRLRESLLGRD